MWGVLASANKSYWNFQKYKCHKLKLIHQAYISSTTISQMSHEGQSSESNYTHGVNHDNQPHHENTRNAQAPHSFQNNASSSQNIAKDSVVSQSNYSPPHDPTANASGSNMLKHIDSLEKKIAKLQNDLQSANTRNEKMAAKTKEGMQSALDTLMKRWMDAVETKEESVKDHFREGMNKLVQNSAEDNGVWQMMVAASALHERQIHDLDKLREENDEMRKSIEGRFATPDSRKRPADHQLDRSDVVEAAGSNMWEDFAADVSKFCS